MVRTIGEVLNRRSDLSTFVVHLTRASKGKSALEHLVSMLSDHVIEARSAQGWARDRAKELGARAEASQRVVCFSEAPLEHIYSLAAEIQGRSVKLEPYGLAFTKMAVRRRGANPVWYVDMSPGHTWADGIPGALASLLEVVAKRGDEGFGKHPGARLFPFMEWMGSWSETSQKEFWWEREWRYRGAFTFTDQELAFVVAPEADHAAVGAVTSRRVLDPSWSLERMIASLAGLSADDVTPFGVRGREEPPPATS